LQVRTCVRSARAAFPILLLLALAGCGSGGPHPLGVGCRAPAGTEPFAFDSGGHRLAGFIDAPPGSAPYPAVLLIPDTGPTDVMSGGGDFAPLRAVFREAGLASVVWDKAGSGCSGGDYRGIADLYARADEVVDAVGALRQRDDIDAARIGLWAVGQGAWIAPMAATMTKGVGFAIVVGAPSRDPAHQQLYMARSNLELEGYAPDQRARWLGPMQQALQLIRGPGTYREYRRTVGPLLAQPFFTKLEPFGVELEIGRSRFTQLQGSAALRISADVFWPAVELPVLALFGDKDTEFDWRDSERVLRRAFAGRSAARLTVHVFPGADHRLCRARTGGIDEVLARDGCEPAPGVVDALRRWLREHKLTDS
jgi:fermentation-respiration switch protein FrsA (DUF1100 family)